MRAMARKSDARRLMGTIVALGVAAAVYPQLLAVVVVILTQPNPRPLLWACYGGSLTVSVGCAAAVLVAFRGRESVLGSTSHRLGPSAYLIIGAIALAIAVLAATKRGRALLGGDVQPAHAARPQRREAPGSMKRAKGRAEEALKGGSLPVAAVVGGLLGVPGPFDLLALGHMARTNYTTPAVAVLIVVFVALKFLLIEIPIASYAINPEGTAARVERLSAWLKANKLAVIAAVIAVIGLVLIARGISRLR